MLTQQTKERRRRLVVAFRDEVVQRDWEVLEEEPAWVEAESDYSPSLDIESSFVKANEPEWLYHVRATYTPGETGGVTVSLWREGRTDGTTVVDGARYEQVGNTWRFSKTKVEFLDPQAIADEIEALMPIPDNVVPFAQVALTEVQEAAYPTECDPACGCTDRERLAHVDPENVIHKALFELAQSDVPADSRVVWDSRYNDPFEAEPVLTQAKGRAVQRPQV